MNSTTLDQNKTRQTLLLAAEKLFAQYGLHGVSLRQISEAAGQKNTSAIQYHFGARDQLVEAVFAMRMAIINPRRQQALDGLKANGRLGDVRALASVMVWPMAEELRPRQEGNYYLQFLSRAARESQLAIELAPPDLMTAWFDVIRHAESAIRYLPSAVAHTRLLIASEQCIFALASYEAAGLSASSDFEMKVETLIDMIAAGLVAPVSSSTLQAMEQRMSTSP